MSAMGVLFLIVSSALSAAAIPVAQQNTLLRSAEPHVSIDPRGHTSSQALLRRDVPGLLEGSEVAASSLTNGGAFTLQGLPTGGVPLTCDTPMCSRSDSCKGAECCNTQMFEAVSAITDWMDKSSVEYVLLQGTLLGAHRDKDIIAWTGDIDIGIYSKDVGKLEAQNDIPWKFGFKNSYVIPRGCENHHPGFPGSYSKATMGDGGYGTGGQTSRSYYVDLYVIDEPTHGGNVVHKCVSSSLKSGHVEKTTVEIRGKQFAAPAAIEDCLVAMYGKSWATPDPAKRSGWR